MGSSKPRSLSGHPFTRYEVEETLLIHFPYCPEERRQMIADRVMTHGWTCSTSIVTAVSIVVHTHIRHTLTDYETWLDRHGITRQEARLMVKPEVDDWFSYWHSGHDIDKPDP